MGDDSSYARMKQIGSVRALVTDYGEMELDQEMRDALVEALSPILVGRVRMELGGEQVDVRDREPTVARILLAEGPYPAEVTAALDMLDFGTDEEVDIEHALSYVHATGLAACLIQVALDGLDADASVESAMGEASIRLTDLWFEREATTEQQDAFEASGAALVAIDEGTRRDAARTARHVWTKALLFGQDWRC